MKRIRSITLALPLMLLAAGCAGEDQAGEELATDEMAMENGMTDEATADAAAMAAQDAPNCRFTASGEELTGRASPPDSASAQISGQTVKICYGAPSVRDREIFGGLEEWDEPWRMGANEPTTLHLPLAARVGEVEVEPGAYSLYAIPSQDQWEVVVNSNVDRWGIPIDEGVRGNDVGSFTVQPETLEQPVEQLNITLEPAAEGATFAMEWADTRITFPITPTQE